MVVGVTTPTPIHLLDTVAVALTTAAAFATCQGSMLVLTRNDRGRAVTFSTTDDAYI